MVWWKFWKVSKIIWRFVYLELEKSCSEVLDTCVTLVCYWSPCISVNVRSVSPAGVQLLKSFSDDLPINYLYVCSICEEGDIKCKNQQFVLSLWTTGLMLCIYWSYSEHLFFIFNLSESCRPSKNMLNTMRVKASLYPQKRNLEGYIGTTLSNCL